MERRFHLATLFDRGYAGRGVVMIETASVHHESSVNVLALDHFVSRIKVPGRELTVMTKSELFLRFPLLPGTLIGKSESEAIFTIGPTFLMHTMSLIPENDWLVYADADLDFHAPLSECLGNLAPSTSVLIAPHRHYLWNRKRLAKFGEFNVGLVAFRNDAQGRLVLKKWAEACLEWCRDYPEDGKYADQKYLESFSSWSNAVAVDTRLGADLAPWNASFKKIRKAEGVVTVNGEKLLYFHMQGLKRRSSSWHLGHLQYLSLAGRNLVNQVYLPYLAKLESVATSLGEGATPSSARSSRGTLARFVHSAFGILQVVLGQTVSLERIERFVESNPTK
jgi:hypothetical protein